MEEKVSSFTNILEIGCGVGFSTLSLSNRGHKVISIEENSYCIEKASKLLEKEGYQVKTISNREYIKPLNKHKYNISYKEINELFDLSDFDVLFIQGDIINDDNFIDWLTNNDSFSIDAVICWLLGTHYSRGNNNIFDLSEVNTPGLARLVTQNKIYELCDNILTKGGGLHIVDRSIEHKTIDVKKAAKENHEDQASITQLEVTEVQIEGYTDPEEKSMKMVSTTFHPMAKDLEVDIDKKIFVSILSIKK